MMLKFILRRLVYGFLVLCGVIVIIFFLFNVLPGDPARMMMGVRADTQALEAIKHDLGLDQSLEKQFYKYVSDLSPVAVFNDKDPNSFLYLDPKKYTFVKLFHTGKENVLVLKYPYLRRSYQTKKKVWDIITETMPETIILAVASILIAIVLGIILGIVAALNKDTWIDNSALVFSALGVSGPSYFIGILMAFVFGFLLSDYTGLKTHGTFFELNDFGDEQIMWANLILPAITLGIRPLAIVVQLTRSSMLEVMSKDFIRTAKAKGLSNRVVVFKHALKNAMTPVLTAVSGWFASLLAGAVLVEKVFDWKGIGSEVVKALNYYDFPVLMGTVLVIAAIFVLINILVDIAYGFLDPRSRVT